MNRLLSLLVSFSLLFTQFAPLSYAHGLNGAEKAFVKRMLDNSTNKSLWGKADNLKKLLSLAQKDSDLKKQRNTFRTGLNTAYDVCSEKQAAEHKGKWPELCKAHYELVRYLYRGEKIPVGYRNFNQDTHNWEVYTNADKKGSRYGNASSSNRRSGSNKIGKDSGDNDKAKDNNEKKDKKKKIRDNPKNPSVPEIPFMKERADVFGMFQRPDSDGLADETELLEKLNYLVKNNVDLSDLVENMVKIFTNQKYQNDAATPLGLEKLFAVFMAYSYQQRNNGKAGFYKLWHYVVFNCKDKALCSFVHKEALAAVQARPQFDKFLKREIEVNSHFKNNLVQEKDFLSLARIGASQLNSEEAKKLLAAVKKMEPQKANEMMLKILSKRGADSMGIVLPEDSSSVLYAGLAVSLPVSPEIFLAGLMSSVSMGTIIAIGKSYMDGNITFDGNEDFNRMLLSFEVASLGTVATLAQDLEPSEDEMTEKYISAPVADDPRYPGKTTQLPGVSSTAQAIPANTEQAVGNPVVVKKTVGSLALAKGASVAKNGNETCVYSPNPSNKSWTLYEISNINRMTTYNDLRAFNQLVQDCGFNVHTPIDALPTGISPDCDAFADQLDEIDYVKNSFVSSQKKGAPLFMQIHQYPGIGFVPAPELPIMALRQVDLIKIVLQWVFDEPANFLYSFFTSLASSKDIMLKGDSFKGTFRRKDHERKPDRNGFVHFHYEELKTYSDNGTVYYYICNHTIKYDPDLLNRQRDGIDKYLY